MQIVYNESFNCFHNKIIVSRKFYALINWVCHFPILQFLGNLSVIFSPSFSCRAFSVAPCFYWGLNDPFCCVHRNKDSQFFLLCREFPIAHSCGDLDSHLIRGYFGSHQSSPNGISITSAVSAQHFRVTYRHRVHILWVKKQYTWLLMITLANLDRFSFFFHWQISKEIPM